MRRIHTAVLVLLSVVCLVISATAQPTQPKDNYVAVVIKVTPPAMLTRSNAPKPIPLQKDVRLYPGDQIYCGENGFASMIFADNAVEQKILANTTITLQGTRTDQGVVKQIFLSIGRVLTSVFNSDMSVITPTSVASVKGTKWWTLVDSATKTEVMVVEGNVRVESRISGAVEIVSAGNTAYITPVGVINVSPSIENQIPSETQNGQQGSLEIEFQDAAGSTRTLQIDFDR
jgi:hypothetical protein